MAQSNKKRIAVLFGGRSVEHEISIITALELIAALDPLRFEAIPVYVSPKGHWYTGDALYDKAFYRGLPDSLGDLNEVELLPVPDQPGLRLVQNQKDHFLSLLPWRSFEIHIPVDVYFPVFHGQYGEDGCVQGLFELADIAYTGCDLSSSAVAMNKHLCKELVRANGIPVLPDICLRKNEAMTSLDETKKRVLSTPGLENFPLFVKPNHLGSSVGVARAADEKALDSALVGAFRFDNEVIVEPCLEEKFEINVSVLEGEEPLASVVEIPAQQSGTLTYEDKYLSGSGKKKGGTGKQGMASLARAIDPPELDEKYKSEVRHYALKAFRLLGCSGVVRFDFIVDAEKDRIYFNELNPLPGSMAYYLWAKSHPPVLYTEMLSQIIDRAIERHFEKRSLKRDLGFRALFR